MPTPKDEKSDAVPYYAPERIAAAESLDAFVAGMDAEESAAYEASPYAFCLDIRTGGERGENTPQGWVGGTPGELVWVPAIPITHGLDGRPLLAPAAGTRHFAIRLDPAAHNAAGIRGERLNVPEGTEAGCWRSAAARAPSSREASASATKQAAPTRA